MIEKQSDVLAWIWQWDSMPSYISERPLWFMQTLFPWGITGTVTRTVLYSAWLFAMWTEHFMRKSNGQEAGSLVRCIKRSCGCKKCRETRAAADSCRKRAATAATFPFATQNKQKHVCTFGQQAPPVGVTHAFVAVCAPCVSSAWTSWASEGRESVGSRPVLACRGTPAWQPWGPWLRCPANSEQTKVCCFQATPWAGSCPLQNRSQHPYKTVLFFGNC